MGDPDQVYESVRDIPIPDNLTELERGEYLACQEALGALEAEWRQLSAGDNVDLKACLDVLEEDKENRRQQAKERLRLRLEILEKQVEREQSRIADETEKARKVLFERIVRSYAHAYQNICTQLKELMGHAGQDFNAFIAANGIEFPQMPPDTQMKTRLQQPEEANIRLSAQDCKRDLRMIQEMFDASEQGH
jgi:hypothetical protein